MAASTQNIVFFDGVCNLCNATVDFLMRRDRARRFRYASLQGQTATRALGPDVALPGGGDPESIFLLRNGTLYRRSAAAVRILADLGGFWKLSLALLLIPWPVRDAVYNVIARNRYRWFGRRESCRLPTPEERELFLP